MSLLTCQKGVSELRREAWCSPEEVFLGAVTVGERGQVVIPAEARKKLDIHPGDKLLVMSHPFATGIILTKVDAMREFLYNFLEGLTGAERAVQEAHDASAPPDAEPNSKG